MSVRRQGDKKLLRISDDFTGATETVLWLFIQCNLYYLIFSEPGPNFTKVFRGFGGFFLTKSGLKSKKCAIRAFLRFN